MSPPRPPPRRARGGRAGPAAHVAQCRGASLPNVIHWGWRGAAAPSNPRPGEAPPCLLITPPPSHSPMTEAWMARTRTWTAAAGYLAGGSRGPDQSVDPPCPQQRSMAFPPGITVEGATPTGEGRWCDHWGAPPPPARWRTSVKKQGVAPSTIPPSRAARSPPGERGSRQAQPRLPLLSRTRETSVPCGFSGKA